MDFLSPILTVAIDLFNCTAKRTSDIRNLRENLECLRGEMELLNLQSEDVKRRVELAKQQQKTPRRGVEAWLGDVDDENREVAAILCEGNGALEKTCLERCSNIRSRCKLVKKVNRKIRRVRELAIREGRFEVVADRLPRPVVDEFPLGHIVGLDSLYERVCTCLSEAEVGIVGLYGRRGIGKTTLMKKINNGLLKTSHGFDTVIWVSVSQKADARAAQEVIGNKLQIIDSTWKYMSQDGKASVIFDVMKTKRFLLFLDNVRERLDLSEMGVPVPDAGSGSKVIIAARSARICDEMKAEVAFKVEPLALEEAWTLFSRMVGAGTISAHPQIRELAHSYTERCIGLPSAIVNVGRILAGMKDVAHWVSSIERVERIIKEEISGEDTWPNPIVDEMPLGHTHGLDSLYANVCCCLTEPRVAIIALYGTGGVGKTTLMKKINNEFLKTSYQFNTVIWVTVSKQASVEAAQEVIRNKLQIPDSMWQGRTENERAKEIFNTLQRKSKFVLLLDDVWQALDLFKIGVPPLPGSGCKVIITTRLQKICNEMEVQRKFRVECLSREDALALFMDKVGETTLNSHPDIQQLSEKVAESCKGLPLALVTVGRAMADKSSPQEWDQVVHELEKFPVEISGMEDGLFRVLKLSYDGLRGNTTKSCFLYCSFFPKEYEIKSDELIEHWIGEGFFDSKDIYEARRQGHKIIEDLKNACLLEEVNGFKGCIKMHDVIHDMALWIAQECGEKMNKIWVCESLGLVDAERVTNWREAERISLWGRNIEKLPETPHSTNLQTLFVRECVHLKTFPREFFLFMPLLRVLNLSATHCLTELPDGVERLINLEYIDLSMTRIKELPIGIRKLTKLRCLLLDGMLPLIIPPLLIAGLSSLQLFSMYDGHALSAYRIPLLEELESVGPVDEISLSFRSVLALNKLLSSCKLQRCMRRLSLHDCKDLLLLELSSIFLNCLECLVMFNCLQVGKIKINLEKEGSKGFERSDYDTPINLELIVRNNQHFHKLRDVKIWCCPKLLNLTWLIYAVYLESLNVQFCESMKEVITNEYIASSAQHASIFTRLTSLVVGAMPMLENIYQGALLFPSLEIISVITCPRLRRLPFDTSSAAKRLKKIEGDLNWWNRLEWEDESVKDIFINSFSPQYLAEPIHPSGEEKGKKVVLVEGSTSRAAT